MLWESWLECDLLQIHFLGRYKFREGGGKQLRDLPSWAKCDILAFCWSWHHSLFFLGREVGKNISTFQLFEDEGHKNTSQNLMEGGGNDDVLVCVHWECVCVCARLTNLPTSLLSSPSYQDSLKVILEVFSSSITKLCILSLALFKTALFTTQ